MNLIKVKEKAQVTIPKAVCKALGIKKGDYLEVKIERNKIVFTPKVLVDKSVELSNEGKKMLNEALEDLKKGKVKKFDNVEKMIEDLKD
ncbi:MAG TPA: AbrB/MazE/SpoVT family DNA-binding domain-containing protein [Caldisericia bacterium]|nr:AbrB/MazE/SpoVT family DNA-binding domain-containing protein [Caldisericia bacterium]HQL67333.1 AbrB/MazE/SpoVT family DNA-binding domain-containing protein [Caldisericia bacterium]